MFVFFVHAHRHATATPLHARTHPTHAYLFPGRTRNKRQCVTTTNPTHPSACCPSTSIPSAPSQLIPSSFTVSWFSPFALWTHSVCSLTVCFPVCVLFHHATPLPFVIYPPQYQPTTTRLTSFSFLILTYLSTYLCLAPIYLHIRIYNELNELIRYIHRTYISHHQPSPSPTPYHH